MQHVIKRKKRKQKAPSVLQRRTLSKYAQQGFKNLPNAMVEAGYSPKIVEHNGATKLVKTKSWQTLIDEYWPDKLLVQVGREGLEATKIVTSPTEKDKVVPDFYARHQYLETALKYKGKSTGEGGGGNTLVIVNHGIPDQQEKEGG